MPRARVVLVHGLRTSATMWRRQLVELAPPRHRGGRRRPARARRASRRAVLGRRGDGGDRPGAESRRGRVDSRRAAPARRAEPRRLPRDRVRGEASEPPRRTGGRVVRNPAARSRPRRRTSGWPRSSGGCPIRGRGMNDAMAHLFLSPSAVDDVLAGGVALDVMAAGAAKRSRTSTPKRRSPGSTFPSGS